MGDPALNVLCSDDAARAREPLAGTAAHSSIWAFVEEEGAWDREPEKSAGLGPIAPLLAAHPEARLQLIRKPRRAPSERAGFLADRGTLWQLDLPRWTRTTELSGPFFFVCTHGKRDRCCALQGNPIYDALARLDNDRVWQTTHLGGHRFAPTLVSMPSGYCFGWVPERDVEALYLGLVAQQLYDLEQVRGNVFLPPRLQAAELAVRKKLDLHGLKDVQLVSEQSDESVWLADGKEHVARTQELRREGTRCKSCGDSATPIDSWVASLES